MFRTLKGFHAKLSGFGPWRGFSLFKRDKLVGFMKRRCQGRVSLHMLQVQVDLQCPIKASERSEEAVPIKVSECSEETIPIKIPERSVGIILIKVSGTQ